MKMIRTSVTAALLLAGAFAIPAAGQETTPAMVAAAEKEGKVVWYTAVDVKVAEAVAKVFRATYPKIAIRRRTLGLGARVPAHQPGIPVEHQERRRGQFLGRLALHLLEAAEVARRAHAARRPALRGASTRTRRAIYATWRASLSVMGYNTNLVTAADAPTGYADLLDPKWKGKLTKSHPSYSGTSLTGTFAITKVLGWDYLEKLSKQGVQQLQSTTATPKSIASGERAVMVDGNEYNMFIEIDSKSPVKIIYPKEGTPFVTSPTAIFADAPHPNAARVLQNFLYTAKIQQLLVNEGGQRSVHPDVKEPADRTPLKDIKLLPDDAAAMLPQIAEIKKRYTAIFGN